MYEGRSGGTKLMKEGGEEEGGKGGVMEGM